MEDERPSKENSPVPSVTSPRPDHTHDSDIASVLHTAEVSRSSLLQWAPVQLLVAPIRRLRSGSPRLIGATSLAEAIEPERTVIYAADDLEDNAGVAARTDSWLARLLTKPVEQEGVLCDVLRGFTMLVAAPFALAAVMVFAFGTTIVGLGKVITGLGHVLTAGQYRSRAPRAQEIAL